MDYADRMQLIRHFFDAAVALDPMRMNSTKAADFPSANPML